jgi:class 3 adenylate cyclase
MAYEVFDPATTQFKFESFGPPSRTLEKVFALLAMLEIESDESREEEIRDQYYDDKERTLSRNDCIIRRRLMSDGKIVMSFAANKKHATSIASERMKVEKICDTDELAAMVENGFQNEISRIFRDKFRIQLASKQIVPLVEVSNKRTIVPFSTAVGKYSLHFDDFCFLVHDVISDEHSEIEIHCETPHAADDIQMQKLLKALQELLDFHSHKLSKARRAIDWSRSKGQDVRTVHCVMFDIVGYSKRTSDVQKQSILVFAKFVREAVVEVGAYDPEHILYIPTGDGLVLVVENNPQSLVQLVYDVQDRVKRFCDDNPDGEFGFRTGLHSGPVFKYRDVNHQPNYAGNGINLAQRVMSLGSPGHILATRETFDNIAGMDAGIRACFHELPAEFTVKHGASLKVYNVFDDNGHGNAAAPEQK